MLRKIHKPPLFDHILYNPHCLFFSLNQSVGGKINGKIIVSNVNGIVGAEGLPKVIIESNKLLMNSI